jgi:hypothetical protein
VATTRFGEGEALALPPLVTVRRPWGDRLRAILAEPDDVERAAGLLDLALETDPAATERVAVLRTRLEEIRGQYRLLDLLKVCSARIAQRQFDEVLALLDGADPALSGQPRLLRVRILALLGLERLDEADAGFERLKAVGAADVPEFLSQYPRLAFSARMTRARQLLAEGRTSEAEALLAVVKPVTPEERRRLDYYRAFRAALDGYEARRRGRVGVARESFGLALGLLAPHLADAQAAAEKHLLDLHARLEHDLD